jgi:hypothetical protein
MTTATYNKFNAFARDLVAGTHHVGSDTFRVMLSNTAPSASLSVAADVTEIAAGNGYPAGGNVVALTVSLTGGTAKVSPPATTVFTASGGNIGPFQYAVLYNDTAAGKPLVGWWDYGMSTTIRDTDDLTINFDTVGGLLTVT